MDSFALTEYVCQSQVIDQQVINNPDCIVGDIINESPKVLLWGDSNAAHYIGLIGAFAEKAGFQFRNLQIGSCPPIDSDAIKFASSKRIADCQSSAEVTIAAVKKFKIVIISANWSEYYLRSDDFFESFFRTVDSLLGAKKKVILIGKVPIIPMFDRLCREKELSYPFLTCKTASAPLAKEIATVNRKLKEYALNTSVVY